MKPLLSESQDDQSLRLLGRASVQIVHDLKNQLNGLKLYATFLRKRLEKSERPADELETVNKLIAGLDRGAADLSLIGQFGQPVQLRKQTGVDLRKTTESVVTELNENPPVTGPLKMRMTLDSDGENLTGDFDTELLNQALKWIATAASKSGTPGEASDFRISLSRNAAGQGVIEWPITDSSNHDPFRSLVGGDGLRLAQAARIIEAHGGTAERQNDRLQVRLPLSQ